MMTTSDSKFLSQFFKESTFLKSNPEYVKTQLLYTQTGNYGILGKRIKTAYKKYVEEGDWTEETFKNALNILIHTEKIFTYKNLEDINKFISSGVYDDLLDKITETEEFEKLDWGDIF